MIRRRLFPYPWTFVLVSFVIWIAVSLRWIIIFIQHAHPYLWLLSAMLAAYGVLLVLPSLFSRVSRVAAHLYFGVQTTLIIAAMLLYYELDFFALLFVPLAGQVFFAFPRRTAFVWVVVFGVATVAGQLVQFGGVEALSFSFLYLAGLLLVAAFSHMMLRADEARLRSEQLLEELQQAHRQLQEYAGQTEELATARERNRLARELHDSVAQTLYGVTLQAEAAARKLDSGRAGEVADYLREIRDSSQQTLQETRLLIFELRSPILEKEGLAQALRARLESVESRSGLKTHIGLQEIGRLPDGLESGMYGIANEALNNVLKHARASEVKVSLEKKVGKVVLEISDNGIGFDADSAPVGGGLGLKGMRERAAQIGGDLHVRRSERGTQVTVEVPHE